MEDKQQILRNIEGLESLKKKSFSAFELRGGDQMMNRLKRMQEKSFEKRLTAEQERLRSILKDSEQKPIKKLTGLDLLDGGAKEELDFFDSTVFNIPTKTKVKKSGGLFF